MDRLPSDIAKKILTIGPDYRNHRGGIGAVIAVYSKYYEVFNFIPSYRAGTFFYRNYVFVICLLKLFYTLTVRRDIKIIHIHGASYGSFYRKYIIFLIGKYFFRKKIIYHIHGGGFKEFYGKCGQLSKRMINRLFSGADLVFCLSSAWYDFYKNTFRTNKLLIIPNVIDHPERQPGTEKVSVITFLFLGLITEAKGIYDLMSVISQNKSFYSGKVRFLIGGNGETRKLEDLIQKDGLMELVSFIGWVDTGKKVSVLNNSDVFILPSYNEGSPISILEAMSYGMAVISTNVGGIPEIVTDNENGLLVQPGNTLQLGNAINTLIENPHMMRTFGANSEKMVGGHLPEQVMKELEKAYLTLLP